MEARDAVRVLEFQGQQYGFCSVQKGTLLIALVLRLHEV
jgi:hypothetical protein